MASPLKKQSVDLASPRMSRIRRDPPPPPKKTVVVDRDDYDRRTAAIGVVAFALAIVVILVGFASYNGWSPKEYTVHIVEEVP